MEITRMANVDAFQAGRASNASWDMTSVKWLIAMDMANVLMGNVFVPEDIQEMLANKVSKYYPYYLPTLVA